MADSHKDDETAAEDKRNVSAVRLRNYMEVVVEDKLSYTLIRAAIADISATGMRMLCEQYLPKATKYMFTMKRHPFLEMRGEVRWVRPFENQFQIGVLFIDVSEDDRRRLALFLEHEHQRVPTTNS